MYDDFLTEYGEIVAQLAKTNDGTHPPDLAKESFWQFLRKENPYVFSNHPPVPVFREHVWSFFGFYFSKGLISSTGSSFTQGNSSPSL